MWMELERKAGVQILAMGHRAKPRNVEVGLLEIAPELRQQARDQLLGARMVDERGLELGEDLDVPLRRHAVLGHRGLVRAEGRLAELAREPGQERGALARREGE